MIDNDLFRAVLGRFASGVTVVTTRDANGNPHGMTVSAFSSLSLDPPLVLVCIGNDASTAPVMARAESFAVNVLRDDQEALSRRFASVMSQRFEGIGYHGSEGDPRLEGVLAWMQCRVVAQHPSGDHVIYVGEVEQAGMSDGRPLLYYRGGYATLER
ncbi:MAG TPA: flavin reductase [Gemmatimonas aurantiaca]|uniref:Flavin reductase n=2 Tax=Gemmatimonas aurantiaca TaxID=173480 RepID=A0A3D4VB73_9BACT|nr:flavin reductase family protein [Gemmatimonas aurantiaca]BAH39630.1 putative oxidoreductase [Gemmatimonas aurantiaca T-27]HCT58361.1 flavin reductase [Gemmatimonas aurantiaca]